MVIAITTITTTLVLIPVLTSIAVATRCSFKSRYTSSMGAVVAAITLFLTTNEQTFVTELTHTFGESMHRDAATANACASGTETMRVAIALGSVR